MSTTPEFDARFSPAPCDYDRELLEITAEECNEVAQRALKSVRFGINEVQPGQPHDNAFRLGEEIGQLLHMVSVGIKRGLIDTTGICVGEAGKPAALAKFMRFKPPVSDVEEDLRISPGAASLIERLEKAARRLKSVDSGEYDDAYRVVITNAEREKLIALLQVSGTVAGTIDTRPQS